MPDLSALYPELRTYARGRTDRPEDADDLVQDAFVRWLTASPRRQSVRSRRAWLRTVIRRLAVDRVRRPTYDVLDQQPLSLDEPWARGE